MRRAAPLALLAALATAQSALADGDALLDYRDHAFVTGSAFYSQAEHRKLANALKSAPAAIAEELGAEFAIMGDAEGAFTKPGSDERIFLLQKEAPVAIDPFPQGPAPVLVAMRGEKAVGFFRLPANVQYQRLVAAADGTGDGRDELLLETSFMNMGQSVTSLDVIELGDDGTAKPAHRLEDVYVDGCDNPAGERTRTAATITVASGGFSKETHDVGCSK